MNSGIGKYIPLIVPQTCGEASKIIRGDASGIVDEPGDTLDTSTPKGSTYVYGMYLHGPFGT